MYNFFLNIVSLTPQPLPATQSTVTIDSPLLVITLLKILLEVKHTLLVLLLLLQNLFFCYLSSY